MNGMPLLVSSRPSSPHRCWQKRVPALALVVLATAMVPAHAEQFELEGSILDTTTSNSVSLGKESGQLAAFFEAQKKLVVQVLGDMGIPLDSLPADVRAKLGRVHTTNFEAFKMFSLGLDAQDKGKFAEAKAYFEKAVQIDPNFDLAAQKSVSMPDTNVTNAVQLQAVLSSATKAATESGKVQIQVDLAQAIAALQSGQAVYIGSKPDSATQTASQNDQDYTSNPPGSAAKFGSRVVAGVGYSVGSAQVASTGEWTESQVQSDANGLASMGDTTSFYAERSAATGKLNAPIALNDGSSVSWGTWTSSSGASARVFDSKAGSVTYPTLGSTFEFMTGPATTVMPTTGKVTFSAVSGGGFLNNVTGNIGVDFVNRTVSLNSLGFDLAGQTYSGLTGQSTYSNSVGSGFFSGKYTGGNCPGCAGFSATASSYTGNFMGKNADGLLFSTIMQTGSGTAAGVHLFSQ